MSGRTKESIVPNPDSEYDPYRWHGYTVDRSLRRRQTRWLMLLGLVAMALVPVVMVCWPDVSVIPLLVTLPTAALLSPFDRAALMSKVSFDQLDEFEQNAMLTALRRAHVANIVMIMLLFLWLAVSQQAGWPIPDSWEDWYKLGAAVVLTMAMLPVFIAEWTVPFPDTDEPSA